MEKWEIEAEERGCKFAKDNGWGFTCREMLEMIGFHKLCREFGMKEGPVIIEAALEDANFHTLCGLLNAGDYDEAYEYVERDE